LTATLDSEGEPIYENVIPEEPLTELETENQALFPSEVGSKVFVSARMRREMAL
jgi:hypothetical protein